MTNYKQLCAELVAVEDALMGGATLVSNQGQALDGYSALASFRSLANRARAALAEPEPEVPTSQELKTFACEWWSKFGFVKDKATCCWVLDEIDPDHFVDFARDVLARWGK